ncbi:MAG: recombinase family protein [Eubacterium sp.]|nr:recombinase family protein [Eubacterium sp.]MCM1304457.1 recombinase family protein [Butyrivibrio sp.]MCM1343912.1 recombinase family protein [Muribaculaceae bacterium]MCM1408928.1 recombinase family protein [Lachnospiraceae bacterium]
MMGTIAKARVLTLAFYMRLSSEDAHEGESCSIANQRDLLYSYVREHREFDGCSILEFSDDGWSGVNFDRPGFQKMMALAGKTVSCILVKDFSRFGRNLLGVGDYLDQILPFLGVRFIAVNEGYDSGNGMGSSVSLDVSLKAFVYEMYSRDVSEKVRSIKMAKMRKGEYQGAIGFYGYRMSEKVKNKLEIDEPAAEVVRRIFRMAGEGKKSSQIALELNRDGILSPLMYRRANRQGSLRGWKTAGDRAVWTRDNVRHILEDERYTGRLVSHKQTTEGISTNRIITVPEEEWIMAEDAHDAIVSKQVYAKAQRVVRHCVRKESPQKSYQKFRGMLKCGCCGKVLVRGTGKRFFYTCRTARSVKGTGCEKIHLDETELEETLLAAIHVQAKLFVSKEPKLQRKADNDIQKDIKECQGMLSRCKALQAAAFEDFAEGRISEEEYLSKKKEMAGYQKEINIRIAELNDQLTVQQGLSAEHEVNLGKYVFMEELTREVLVELVREIRVYENNRIEIKWNFREEMPVDALS